MKTLDTRREQCKVSVSLILSTESNELSSPTVKPAIGFNVLGSAADIHGQAEPVVAAASLPDYTAEAAPPSPLVAETASPARHNACLLRYSLLCAANHCVKCQGPTHCLSQHEGETATWWSHHRETVLYCPKYHQDTNSASPSTFSVSALTIGIFSVVRRS